MSKIISSDALNVVISKGLVRTYENYFSDKPVKDFKEASKRFKNKCRSDSNNEQETHKNK